MGDYYGYKTRQLTSRFLEVECLEEAGPRIVRLKYKGSSNLFAELPEKTVESSFGVFHLLGGHRLWHAPEAMPRTYMPDNDGLTITAKSDGLILDGKTETATGVRKRMQIELDQEQPRAVVTHTLTNDGLWDVEIAPWAITMLRSGGVVILPTQVENQDTESLLPNRHFALWSYSHIDDSRLHLGDEFILVEAKTGSSPFKIGTYTPSGWIAYWNDGILFRKSFDVYHDITYPDNGCNIETYSAANYVELESLGPLTKLSPGESVQFTETWELFNDLEQISLPKGLIDRVMKK